MENRGTNPRIEAFFSEAEKWRDELRKLRQIILGCGLTEELKWGKPCYTFQNSNIVLLIGFKNTCSLLFTKGALLHDTHGILIKPGENTQAARQIRFTNLQDIVKMETVLKGIISEAIEVEKAGLEVKFRKNIKLKFPEELKKKLDEMPALKTAFGRLTPGRQRLYNIYFSAAKQSVTRQSRIEKSINKILEGKGLNDEYLRRK
jgi:uncharacterized protein YdeI (YjbR/CyaY-like superfamily)